MTAGQIPRELLMEEAPASPSAGQETAPHGRVARQALHPSCFSDGIRCSLARRIQGVAEAPEEAQSTGSKGSTCGWIPKMRLPSAFRTGATCCWRFPPTAGSSRTGPRTTEAIEREFEEFWDRFRPGIVCEGIRLLTTDRITLAHLERYQRFDADWVSFEDADSRGVDGGRPTVAVK